MTPQLRNLLAAMANHVASERHAADLYRAAASWCEQYNWVGSAAFFASEVKDEDEHAERWRQYIQDRDGPVPIEAAPAVAVGGPEQPLARWYENMLAAELEVLAEINELCGMAAEANEWGPIKFMQQFIESGENQIRDLSVWVNELQRIGPDMGALVLWDKGCSK